MSQKKVLGTFSLGLLMVVAVDSIRALPISAEFGMSLVFFYILGAVCFMIPIGLCAAELATGWPANGGAYVWVKAAFGGRWGFWAAWLQWIYNLVWFPTILAFLVESSLKILMPSWVHSRAILVLALLSIFAVATLVNWFGLRTSSILIDICAIFGTLLPIVLIIVLGAMWVNAGKPVAIDVSLHDFWPNFQDSSSLAMLSGLLFGMIGLEMPAIYAGQIRDPGRQYPRALLLAGLVILSTSVLGALSLAVVIPRQHLNLGTGVVDALHLMLQSHGLLAWAPLMVGLIVLGGFGGVCAWVLAPTQCLMEASRQGDAPAWMAKCNKYGAPSGMLLVQAVIFAVLSMAYLLFPAFNSAYWLLSAITAQLALLFYSLIFASLLRLRVICPTVVRPFKIAGGRVGVWSVAGVGLATCMITFALSWMLPTSIIHTQQTLYHVLMLVGVCLAAIPPLLWTATRLTP